MFNSLGSWLGIKDENVRKSQEKETFNADNGGGVEVNSPCDDQQMGDDQTQLLQQARGFSGHVYNAASRATKKLSDSAHTLQKNIKGGSISSILDKTIFGDFQKEQDKFVEEKRARQLTAAVPPWIGCNDEDGAQQQILALSIDKRNFVREPPAGEDFHFDFDRVYPVAMVMLEEDELLRKMRFHLVPKRLKEEVFWRNYFYRVTLIKQSTSQQTPETQQVQGDATTNTRAEARDWEQELHVELQECEKQDYHWEQELHAELQDELQDELQECEKQDYHWEQELHVELHV